MQIVALKFLLIFWIACFNGKNVNCAQIVLKGDVDDATISEKAQPMFRDWKKNNFLKTTAEVSRMWWMRDFKCCSESYLFMDLSYFLNDLSCGKERILSTKIQNANGDLTEQWTILTDDRFVIVSNLQANNTYTIKQDVYQLNKNSKMIPEYQLKTLSKEHTPAIVPKIEGFMNIINNEITHFISWSQAEDMVCSYNVLIFSPFGEVEVYIDRDVPGNYIKLPNITAINFLEVHVQGINQVNNKQIKGGALRNIFDVSHSENGMIPLEHTKKLQVMSTHKYDNVFSINIAWEESGTFSYMLRILDLDRNLKKILARVTQNITTHKNFIDLSNVTLNGTEYEVHLVRIGDEWRKDSYYFISSPIPPKIDNRFGVSPDIHEFEPKPVPSKTDNVADNPDVTPATSNYAVLVVSPVIVILAVALLILIIFHRRSNRKLYQEELAKKIRQELENSLFINDEMEIDRHNVLLLDEVLGEGAFGLVRKGLMKLNDTSECEVAVKMLKDNANIDDIKEFYNKIQVMKLVGAHPNIVRIIGHFTRNASEMLLFAEYCSQGNLLLYLRAEWHYVYRSKFNTKQKEKLSNDNQADTTINFDKEVASYENMKDSNRELPDISQSTDYKSSDNSNLNSCELGIKLKSIFEEFGVLVLPKNHTYYDYPKSGDIDQPISRKQGVKMRNNPLTSGDLLRIAKQIAQGMVFLSKNKVVHRNLAARNVLVCEDNTVKISEFGLSRDIYAENMYKKSANGKLPIKWLALESMRQGGVYTTRSDVWSYGILLYEIVTLGGIPYPLVPVDGLLKYLKSGERMEKPNNCSQALYDLMKSCWSASPTERPTFADICQIIDEMLIVTHEK